MNIQSEYGLLVAVTITDIAVGDTFFIQSNTGAIHETICIENDGYTIVTNRKTWVNRGAKLFKKVENTAQSVETVESNNSSVALPAKTSKNSVVCSIAAKLAKQNVKNPMAIAWLVHRNIIKILDAIRVSDVTAIKQAKKEVWLAVGWIKVCDCLSDELCRLLYRAEHLALGIR